MQQPIGRVSQPQANGQDGGLPAPVPILASTDSGLRPDQQVNLFTAGLRLRIDLGAVSSQPGSSYERGPRFGKGATV